MWRVCARKMLVSIFNFRYDMVMVFWYFFLDMVFFAAIRLDSRSGFLCV